MKKMILACALMTAYLGSMAQTDTTRNKTNKQNTNKEQPSPDGKNNTVNQDKQHNPNNPNSKNQAKQGTESQNPRQDKMDKGQNPQPGTNSQCALTLENGKVMILKDGLSTEMLKDSTLSNGSMVMSNGFIKMKDGTTRQLKNGECMDMNGRLIQPGTGEGSKGGTKNR